MWTSQDLRQRLGFPGGAVVRNLPANAGDVDLILELGRSSGERNGNPLQSSCLGNSMDKGAWWTAVHGGHKRVGYDLATKQQQQENKLTEIIIKN